MTQDTFPEIQVATEALEPRIAITEGEVGQMKQDIAGKRRLLRSLRKALATINTQARRAEKAHSGSPEACRIGPGRMNFRTQSAQLM
jgi:hypothetical protein